MQLHEKVNASLIKGASFEFESDGAEIIYEISQFSGREQVTVDGEIASRERNFKLKSVHHFSVREVPCRIEYECLEPLKGKSECRFFRDDRFVSGYRLLYTKRKRSMLYKASPIICGVAMGAVYVTGALPAWAIALVLLLGAALVSKSAGHFSCHEIEVERPVQLDSDGGGI